MTYNPEKKSWFKKAFEYEVPIEFPQLGPLVLCLLIIFLIGFCTGNAVADPLKILDEFHAENSNPRSPPATNSSLIDSFHKQPTQLPPEPQKQAKNPKKPVKLARPQPPNPKPVSVENFVLFVEKSEPFVIGHSPYPKQSVRLNTDLSNYYLNLNLQLVAKEFNKVEILKTYLKGLAVLDPILEVGTFVNVLPDKKDYYFYIGAVAGFNKGDHGLSLKALVMSNSYKNLLESSIGRVSAYYHTEKRFTVGFASFYGGWISPPVKINFSNIDEFKKVFKDLSKLSETIAGGVFYQPYIDSNYSFNFEANLKQYTLALNYFF